MARTATSARVPVRNFISSANFSSAGTDTLYTNKEYVQDGLITDQLTVCAWAKPSALVTSSNRCIAGQLRAALPATEIYGLQVQNDNRMRFRVSNGTIQGEAVANTTTKISISDWAFYVGTYDGTTVKLYVNGVLQTTTAALTGNVNNSPAGGFAIGSRVNGLSAISFNGKITDVSLYNRALSQDEITAAYKGNYPSDTPLGRWLISGSGGTTVADTGSLNNPGTLSGTTLSRDVPFVARQPVNPNLVYNGDFEIVPPFVAATTTSGRWIDGTAAGSTTNTTFGWLCVINAGGTAAMNFDTSVFHNSSASMKIAVSVGAAGTNGIQANLGGAAGPSTATQRAYFIPVSSNTTYVLTFWMKTDSITAVASGGAKIILAGYSGNGTGATVVASTAYVTGTSDWTQYTATITTSSTTAFINIQLHLDGETGTAWFDDIVLRPTTPVTRSLVS